MLQVLLRGGSVETIELNDFEMPIYSEDREKEMGGQPQEAKDFLNKIKESDLLIISLAEHNGSYTAAYKNILDWASRVDRDIFAHKPILYLGTSPGPGGASTVLDFAVNSAKFFAGDVKAQFSLPSFYDNFDLDEGRVSNDELNRQLSQVVKELSL